MSNTRLLQPAIELQRTIRRKTLGLAYWQSQQQRREREFRSFDDKAGESWEGLLGILDEAAKKEKEERELAGEGGEPAEDEEEEEEEGSDGGEETKEDVMKSKKKKRSSSCKGKSLVILRTASTALSEHHVMFATHTQVQMRKSWRPRWPSISCLRRKLSWKRKRRP